MDVGGGTGAATWAVNATWAGARPVTVLDWAEPALALGREIAAANPELKSAEWHRSRIGSALTIESTDLVTVSYVLGELTDADRASVVTAAATAAQAVVIIEPGTPDGYARVIEARERLIAAGFHVAAPARTARPARSSPARTGATSPPGSRAPPCTVRSREAPALRGREVQLRRRHPLPADPGPSRVVRKPQIRKGQVLLDLCGPDRPCTARR